VVFNLSHIRVWLTWTVAACFALVTTCGEGIHLLPGLGHGCSHLHCCCDFDFGHSTAPSFRSGHDGPEDLNDADCPVCNFFAAAKCLPAVVSVETGFAVVVETIAANDVLTIIGVLSAYHSRAPPLG
jgi:hypothetical protein